MKVFGIGLHKTGTTTLRRCFELLNLDTCPEAAGYALFEPWSRGEFDAIFSLAEKHQAFEDSPWCHDDLYKQLDHKFPGSKFILTTRAADQWLASLKRWTTWKDGAKISPDGWLMHKRIYGYEQVEGNEEHYLNVFRSREKEVIDYFKGRSDLLIADWSKNGWKELCEFLNVKIPDCPFPHLKKYDPDKDDYLNLWKDRTPLDKEIKYL